MSVNPKADIVFESGSALHRSCMQWKIRHFSANFEEFSKHPADDERALHSPDYSTDSDKQWVCSTYLTESLDIEFYIHLDSLKEDDITSRSMCIHTELSLIIDGKKHETQKKTIKKFPLQVVRCIWKMKISDFRKFMKKNLKDDKLCINLELEEWSKRTITVKKSHDNDSAKSFPIGNTIINFLTNQTLTDVTLQCQGKNFKAHKLILAAASPVFQAMFKEATTENGENNVNIQDINSNVFEVFLRYLYSDQVDQLDEMYLELFAAADKYDVQPLRDICIRHMATNISVDNGVEVLALAERHSIEPTKSLALQFLKTNFPDVVGTDSFPPISWSSLLVNHRGAAKRMRDGGSQTEESARKRQK
jgi:hypothetical protein